jgi:hypothetical protein
LSRPEQAVEVECGVYWCKYVRMMVPLMAVKKLYICLYAARDNIESNVPKVSWGLEVFRGVESESQKPNFVACRFNVRTCFDTI